MLQTAGREAGLNIRTGRRRTSLEAIQGTEGNKEGNHPIREELFTYLHTTLITEFNVWP